MAINAPELRAQQIYILSKIGGSPSMYERYSQSFERVIERWVEVVAICQSKGWSDTFLDPRTLALILHGMMLGRTIDDFSQSRVVESEWAISVGAIANWCFFGKADREAASLQAE